MKIEFHFHLPKIPRWAWVVLVVGLLAIVTLAYLYWSPSGKTIETPIPSPQPPRVVFHSVFITPPVANVHYEEFPEVVLASVREANLRLELGVRSTEVLEEVHAQNKEDMIRRIAEASLIPHIVDGELVNLISPSKMGEEGQKGYAKFLDEHFVREGTSLLLVEWFLQSVGYFHTLGIVDHSGKVLFEPFSYFFNFPPDIEWRTTTEVEGSWKNLLGMTVLQWKVTVGIQSPDGIHIPDKSSPHTTIQTLKNYPGYYLAWPAPDESYFTEERFSRLGRITSAIEGITSKAIVYGALVLPELKRVSLKDASVEFDGLIVHPLGAVEHFIKLLANREVLDRR